MDPASRASRDRSRSPRSSATAAGMIYPTCPGSLGSLAYMWITVELHSEFSHYQEQLIELQEDGWELTGGSVHGAPTRGWMRRRRGLRTTRPRDSS